MSGRDRGSYEDWANTTDWKLNHVLIPAYAAEEEDARRALDALAEQVKQGEEEARKLKELADALPDDEAPAERPAAPGEESAPPQEEKDGEKALLFAAFPALSRLFTAGERAELDAGELLQAVYPKDPALAVQMWRRLLDASAAELDDPEKAGRLLGLELTGGRLKLADVENGAGDYGPILDELEREPRFARQVFGSACCGILQRKLLAACAAAGRNELRESLRGLLAGNPHGAVLWPYGVPGWVSRPGR